MASSFQARVDAAFGALSATPQQPSDSWAVSEQQVHRSGKETGYSSDEEEQARAADAQREQLLPEGLLHFEGGADGADGGELPSHAFCRALDEEEDFDAHDALASGAVDARPERRPPRHTEVLEDNVFEARSRARATSGSEPGAMEIEPHGACPPVAQATRLPDQEEAGEQPPPAENAGKAAKRVRFAEPDAGSGPSGSVGSLQRGQGPGQQAQQQRPRGGSAGLSYVPDHVRHPEHYTAYALEEPIEVGSGNAGLDGGRGENAQAARAAQAAASAAAAPQPEADAAPALELPTFGGGIAFTPKAQRSRKGEQAGPSRQAAGGSSAGPSAAAAAAAADTDQVEASAAAAAQAMEVDAEEAAGGSAPTGAGFAARGKRQRSLRSRGA